ncbi:MAG: CHC2 zinc finger domain-containing protein, partial [bacterium]|nr:CHC2 zinc finger domain-containing protein [bacterium]
MGILAEDVARVREATDIVGLISNTAALRKSGRRWQGLCPFHSEKTPSFSVNAEEGLYYCFGCRASGDAITFVRQTEGLDFAAAVEVLAARAGVTLRYDSTGQAAQSGRRQQLIEAVAAAVEWYHERLLNHRDAGAARGYLRSRGLSGDEVRNFKLGWAPAGWDELSRALRSKASPKVLIDAGLARRNERGRFTDNFHSRVLFPVFDVRGDPVGFGGRILPGGDGPAGPKYKNTPESALYAKSRLLY